jgi:hypothetical protein
MRFSRPFLIIVAFLCILGGGLYYVVTKHDIFDRVNAENLSPVDTFLFEHYLFTLGLSKKTEDAIRVYCGQTTETESDDTISAYYPCQNENPAHKVVIGHTKTSEKYMTTVQALANDQLFWRNYPTGRFEEGFVTCKERVDYPYYRHALYAMDCVNTTTDGQKLYFSIIFLQPKELTDKRAFIAVLNVSKTTSPQQVETELLALIATLKYTPTTFSMRELFGGTPSFSNNGAGSASSTSQFSTDAAISESNSNNVITKDSGNAIDATVCDAVDVTSCYPIYCNSFTAVWNYSLNKCVEPATPVVTSPGANGNVEVQGTGCPAELPVWDGSKCRALTGNIVVNNTCAIPVGKSSCEMNIFWSTQNTRGDVEVRLPLSETILLGTGVSGKVSHTFEYSDTPYTVELYDNTGKLNDGKFTTKCASGGYEPTLKKCVDPTISSLSVHGEYYLNPGIMKLACSNSDAYQVRNSDTNTVIASSSYTSGEVAIPLTKTGNYAATCMLGTYESTPSVRYFNAPPPPPPEIFFLISPRTLSKNQKTILNWTIHFPSPACKLTASSVCKNNGECTPAQIDSEDAINEILQTKMTDEDDPETSRPIREAVNTVAPAHVDKDWKASGQKTIEIGETTDFLLDCGNGIHEKKRVYVRSVTQTTNVQ